MSPVAALFADLIEKHRLPPHSHRLLREFRALRMERLDGTSRVYLYAGRKWGTA